MLFLLTLSWCPVFSAQRSFTVADFGATGIRTNDARQAIQRAIDACATTGGGTVRIPPGEYTSGTLHLRSHVHLEIQKGATLFASTDPTQYDYGDVPSKAALLFGEGLQDVVIDGGGTLDGQAEYEWRPDDYEQTFDHKTRMQELGKSLMRSFPKGFPKRTVFPHLLWLGGAKDIRIRNLRFLHSPSWTLTFHDCESARLENLHLYTSLKEGVWADGIDMDGCRDFTISDCTVETGDDCIVFISTSVWGPARPCEDITVRDCRLSSASAGIKFSEGNKAGVRRVRIDRTVLTNVNRAIVLNTTLGGNIEDVTFSNLTIDCNRFDWFWAGDGQPFYFRSTRLSEFNKEPRRADEPHPGGIRNIIIRNVTARAKGSSVIKGHVDRPLKDLRIENLGLSISNDPKAPFDVAQNGMEIRAAEHVFLSNVSFSWSHPPLAAWRSALFVEDVKDLHLEKITAHSAWPEREPAIRFSNVVDAELRRSRAGEDSGVFLRVEGEKSRGIKLIGNDLQHAGETVVLSSEVDRAAVAEIK